MCPTSIYRVFSYLTHCRRKLLEARRTKDDYDTAKRSYDRARERFLVVLDTWNGQEDMEIQENRRLLERAYTLISDEAYEFINKAIENALKSGKLGVVKLADRNPGRLAPAGGRQVRPKNSFFLC